MLNEQERLEADLLAIDLARGAYYDYAQYVYKGWQDAAHHRLLGAYLEEVELYVATKGQEGVGRLLIFMPPRHGKSLNASILFPTWFLGRNPDKRVIITSYNGNLAMGFSRQARNVMFDSRFQAVFGQNSILPEPVRIADDSRSVEAWNLGGFRGGMKAAGVGGGITGGGAHLFIVDDPHKGRTDAESERSRETVWNWWTSEAYTRLEDGAAVIGMLTRWHSDDWAGRLLKQMVEDPAADQWKVLCLPAIAEEWSEAVEPGKVIEALKTGWWMGVDPLGRKVGEPLWAGKYDLDVLNSIKANIGGYEWDALYQQRPRRLEGALIKAHRIIKISDEKVPSVLKIVRYWDLAVSGRAGADFIVGAKVGRSREGKLYILDIARFPGPWADARQRMIRVMLSDEAGVEQGIEVSGQQGGYYQELQRDRQLQGRTLRRVNPQRVGNKKTRANVWASRIEDSLVFMVKAHWNDLFISECVQFPRGSHDDQVDGVSGAVQMLSGASRETGSYQG